MGNLDCTMQSEHQGSAKEELSELQALKSNFLAMVSHELRSPLTAITGFARLLHDGSVGPVSSEQERLLGRILVHAGRLGRLVDDLTDLLDMESGSLSGVSLRPVNPCAVLESTLSELEERTSNRSIFVDANPEDAALSILADGKSLQRVFYHLLDNALKFSEQHNEIRVEFVPQGDELSIRVVDFGIGIQPERLSLIFDAFYQIENDLSRSYEGMGIGLTLTKRLLEITGGRLAVRSEPGCGSTFTVTYPRT